jgi:phage terminase small subunit
MLKGGPVPGTFETVILTPKQQRFVDEYLVDLNATQAAVRAGYSAKTARAIGFENLTKPDIQAAISAGQKRLADKLEITQERVLTELAHVAFANLSDVANWGIRPIAIGLDKNGKKLPADELDQAETVRYESAAFVEPLNREELAASGKAAIAEVALTQHGPRIKMHDKVAALDRIARHLGMYDDEPNSADRNATMTHEQREAEIDRLLANDGMKRVPLG